MPTFTYTGAAQTVVVPAGVMIQNLLMKAGNAEATNFGSTATVGAADTDVGLFSTITDAIISIQLFGANAALAIGTFILIEGIA